MVSYRIRDNIVLLLLIFLLSFVAFLFILPILWWLVFAIKDTAGLDMGKSLRDVWFPEHFNLIQNIRHAFSLYPMGRFFLNSFIVTTVVTFSELILASLAGFSFAKYRFKWRDAIFKIVLALLMIPQIVVLIPLFEIIVKVGLVNSYPGLILPFLVTPFGIFLMRQFMYGIPNDYLEAARIEGYGEFKIFFRIVMPLSKNAFATLGIFTFLFQWDSLLWPLIVASRQTMYTLPVGVSLLHANLQVPYNALYASTLLFSLPALVFYLFLQSLIMQSLAMSGLKG